MEHLLTSFGIACFALIVSEVSGIIKSIKYFFGVKRLKPFDCPLCLSFWLAAFYVVFTAQPLEASVLIVGSCPILSILILKHIQ
jgi:hypothetical protein